MLSEWNVSVGEHPGAAKLWIRIWKVVGPGGVYAVLTPMIKDGAIVWGLVDVEEGELAPSTVEFSAVLVKYGVLDALVTALVNYGARPQEDVNQKSLEIMSSHLEDLRTILFQFDRINLTRETPLVKEG